MKKMADDFERMDKFRDDYASFLFDLAKNDDKDYRLMYNLLIKAISNFPQLRVYGQDKNNTQTGKQLNIICMARKMEESGLIRPEKLDCRLLFKIILNKSETESDPINRRRIEDKLIEKAKLFNYNEFMQNKSRPRLGNNESTDYEVEARNPIFIFNINTPWEDVYGDSMDTGSNKTKLFDFMSKDYEDIKELIEKKKCSYKQNHKLDLNCYDQSYQLLGDTSVKYKFAFMINIAFCRDYQTFLIGDADRKHMIEYTINDFMESIRKYYHEQIFILHLTQDAPPEVRNAIIQDNGIPQNKPDNSVKVGKDVSFIHIHSKRDWNENFAYYLLKHINELFECNDVYESVLNHAKKFQESNLGEIIFHKNIAEPLSLTEKELDMQTDSIILPYHTVKKGTIVHLDMKSKAGESSKSLSILKGYLMNEIDNKWTCIWGEAILDETNRFIIQKNNNLTDRLKETDGDNAVFIMLGDRTENNEQKWQELNPGWCHNFINSFTQNLPNFAKNFLKVFILPNPTHSIQNLDFESLKMPPNTILIVLKTEKSDNFYTELHMAFYMNKFEKQITFMDWIIKYSQEEDHIYYCKSTKKPIFFTTSKATLC